ncbi:FadR/GntR family transcriptional regulator [Aneurinibacillus sp. Ricciae_BoGa-3]|uniref:FadR/GntR family transcriptional regulator n=1 Tax=Aneurinibacillus sp. Ricciae_BoGa-3 TaxID=3022697 RepID=UPI002341AB25|nr:FadR/GntR family transcriptional regulator [Aneurinibacillus sp. Ricciae_BoGa-3]WCK54003.1 FadR/GntR family transcriptional regulator [Aneurinibacillus sp. Ricciae_BoGa-3]
MPQFKVKKTYEEVADYLKEQIISGTYRPGERLPSLRELGETMGVGQSTVREAISSLKTIGLVKIKQGEGTFVTKINPEELLSAFEGIRLVTKRDIYELLEVRKILETGTVRLAAERRSEEELARIERALKEMEEALKLGELGDKADWNFHYSVADASHNEILKSVMLSMSETMERTLKASRQKLYRTRTNPEQLYQEHRDIYEAIRLQNSSKAEEAMLYHLLGVEKKMLS